MDVLKRVKEFSLEEKRDVNVYLSYNKAPELDDTGQNPFYWFDEWLLTAQKEGKIHLKPKIEKFVCTEQENGVKFIGDDDLYSDWDSIVFATGYLRSFPFLAPIIRQNYKIFMSPDPRTKHTSNISRVTGLYLHTFSIADPTLAFVGISSNANFQSFQLSAKTISDVWHKFNKLFNNPEITKDPPYYDNIWYNILPSINDQLEWSRKVLALKGNSGAFHFMYPFDVLQEYWLNDCEKLFESDFEQPLFPENTQTLYKYSVGRLKEIFLQTMNR
ncbi:uncharacterized protein SCODWIG_02308 [Saccharomycodes ludwigii]|uniref:Uncharacterized protein n=2 Tax=Saccharomycodes ludwigii TaxID=36035 RepID=A0A376B775_9ASCO|nr:uncharacterized protein SCODWIG_02308 [Saccharomycodes ludwigii]